MRYIHRVFAAIGAGFVILASLFPPYYQEVVDRKEWDPANQPTQVDYLPLFHRGEVYHRMHIYWAQLGIEYVLIVAGTVALVALVPGNVPPPQEIETAPRA